MLRFTGFIRFLVFIFGPCDWVFFIEVKFSVTLRCRLEYGSFMFGLKRLTFFLLRLIFSVAQHFMLKGNVLAVL